MSIPATLRPMFESLNPEAQISVKRDYERRRKSNLASYLLWLIGCHYIYFGKFGIWAVYVLSGAGLLVWMAIDVFRIPLRNKQHNEDLARELMVQYKSLTG